MTLGELIHHYPTLFHMAAAGSWPSIQKHGLLSTSALLDLYEVSGGVRDAIEAAHRPETVAIKHSKYGTAYIRDQKPMSDSGLRRALEDGLDPETWYRTLNSKVFFWTSKARLLRLLSARAYRDSEHDVLEVTSAPIVKRYSERIRLAPINTGCTKPFPHPRGTRTFLSVGDYPWTDWVKKRGVEDAVVEVAFEGGLPDVGQSVRRVVRMRAGKEVKTLFKAN